MNTHSYNKHVKNETERYKTILTYDNVINPSANEYFKYLDKNDVVPLSIDASKYYNENLCYREEAIDTFTDEEKKMICLKVYLIYIILLLV